MVKVYSSSSGLKNPVYNPNLGYTEGYQNVNSRNAEKVNNNSSPSSSTPSQNNSGSSYSNVSSPVNKSGSISSGSSSYGGGVVALGKIIVTNPFDGSKKVISETSDSVKAYNDFIQKNVPYTGSQKLYDAMNAPNQVNPIKPLTSTFTPNNKISQQENKQILPQQITIKEKGYEPNKFVAPNNEPALKVGTNKSLFDQALGTNFVTNQTLTNTVTGETFHETKFVPGVYASDQNQFSAQNQKLFIVDNGKLKELNTSQVAEVQAIGRRQGSMELGSSIISSPAVIGSNAIEKSAFPRIANFAEKYVNPSVEKYLNKPIEYASNKISSAGKKVIEPIYSANYELIYRSYNLKNKVVTGIENIKNPPVKPKISTYGKPKTSGINIPFANPKEISTTDSLIVITTKEIKNEGIVLKPKQKIGFEPHPDSKKVIITNQTQSNQTIMLNRSKTKLQNYSSEQKLIYKQNQSKDEIFGTLLNTKQNKTIIKSNPRTSNRVQILDESGLKQYTTIYEKTPKQLEKIGENQSIYSTKPQKFTTIIDGGLKQKNMINVSTTKYYKSPKKIDVIRSETPEGLTFKENFVATKPVNGAPKTFERTSRIIKMPNSKFENGYNFRINKPSDFINTHPNSGKVVLSNKPNSTSIYKISNSKVNLPRSGLTKPKNQIIQRIKNDFKNIHSDQRGMFRPITITKTETETKPTTIIDVWQNIMTNDDGFVKVARPKEYQTAWEIYGQKTELFPDTVKPYVAKNKYATNLITGATAKTAFRTIQILGTQTRTTQAQKQLTFQAQKQSQLIGQKQLQGTKQTQQIITINPGPIPPQKTIKEPLNNTPPKPIINTPTPPETTKYRPLIPPIYAPSLLSNNIGSGSGRYGNKYGVKNRTKYKSLFNLGNQKIIKEKKKLRLI